MPAPWKSVVGVKSSKPAQVSEKTVSSEAEDNVLPSSDDEVINEELQKGVQKAQAMMQLWKKRDLIAIFIIIWVIQFVLAFSSGIIGTLTPYVTSSFEQHSLTALTGVISTLIAGLIKLPYAKSIDIWGRAQGFAFMVLSITIGTIMMAGCNNVKTYCAAQVFYWVGYNGIDFTITIFIADTTKLKNRAFILAYTSSCYIATVWAYGPAAESILNTIGFRWGFGIWAIIIPVVCSPLFGLLYYYQQKPVKVGLIPKREKSGRTFWQSVVFYGKEFDVIGIFILALGLALFLLGFNLYSYQKNEWRSPLIICFLIIGGLLIISFGIWEYFAPVSFIPWELLTNRTVIFTYSMAAAMYCSFYIWDSYFFSFIIVVFNLSTARATYITNIYSIGSCFCALVVGVIIRCYGRLKSIALFWGVPITMLGCGLMIKYRSPDSNLGLIVMCQLFIAFGGGALVICEQMTVMAVSAQQHIPAVLAMEAMVIAIGEAVGQTIAGAMWTGIFPKKLAEYLPADVQDQLLSIYGSLTVQISYPRGTAAREAIDRSYGDTQRLMCIAATCIYATCIFSTLLWKEVNVKEIKQVKGLTL